MSLAVAGVIAVVRFQWSEKVKYLYLLILLIPSWTFGGGIEDQLLGFWGWPVEDMNYNCEGNPHTLSFSSDGKEFTINFRKPIKDPDGKPVKAAKYDVIEVTNKVITASMRGEARKDGAGNDVIWDLVLVDTKTYTWHRHDWPEGTFTPNIVRCEKPYKKIQPTPNQSFQRTQQSVTGFARSKPAPLCCAAELKR